MTQGKLKKGQSLTIEMEMLREILNKMPLSVQAPSQGHDTIGYSVPLGTLVAIRPELQKRLAGLEKEFEAL